MKKSISRIIGVIMLIIAIVFIMFALEQYNYLVTVWYIFSCDSSAAYCSEDEKVRNFKFVEF